MKNIVRIFLLLMLLVPAFGQPPSFDARPAPQPSLKQRWLELGGELPGMVYAMTELEDALYLIYDATNVVSGETPRRVARWDGEALTMLDSSTIYGSIFCMGTYRGKLYLGGGLRTHPDSIALYGLWRWDGEQWQRMGGRFDQYRYQEISDMIEFRGELYCAGKFLRPDPKSLKDLVGVVRFDGTDWNDAGNLPSAKSADPSFSVGFDLEIHNGELYLSGALVVDSIQTCVAKWDGRDWTALPGIEDYYVDKVISYNGQIHCFDNADHPENLRLMRWNGTAWSSLGSEFPLPNFYIYSAVVYNNDLYVSGYSHTDDPQIAIVRWDGTGWSVFTSFRDGLMRFAVLGNRLYMGGSFTAVDEDPEHPLRYFAVLDDADVLSVAKPAMREDLLLFPNPLRGNLTITGEIRTAESISVRDMLGNTLLQQRCTGGEVILDLDALPAGSYFVTIPLRGGMVTRRIRVLP